MSVIGKQTSLVLEKNTRTRQADGTWAESWGTVETIKGALNGMGAQESVRYEKFTSLPLYKFWAEGKKADRTTRTVTTDERFTFGTRTFEILFVNNIFQENNILEMDLQEITDVS